MWAPAQILCQPGCGPSPTMSSAQVECHQAEQGRVRGLCSTTACLRCIQGHLAHGHEAPVPPAQGQESVDQVLQELTRRTAVVTACTTLRYPVQYCTLYRAALIVVLLGSTGTRATATPSTIASTILKYEYYTTVLYSMHLTWAGQKRSRGTPLGVRGGERQPSLQCAWIQLRNEQKGGVRCPTCRCGGSSGTSRGPAAAAHKAEVTALH